MSTTSPIDPTKSIKLSTDEIEDAISSFRSILKYPTVSSLASDSGAYSEYANYILSRLNAITCLSDVGILSESPINSPVVVARWEGAHANWPVILLNSHYDVVPAILDDWTVDPFGAERKDGRVRLRYRYCQSRFFFLISFMYIMSHPSFD